MQIIPAIDLLGGKCVRLKQGDYSQKTVFYHNPVDAAKHFVDQGAEILHLVDLDGARTGTPQNLGVVEEIIGEVSVPVQLGGGIRSYKTVQDVLNCGVQRAILGTVVTKRPDWVIDAVESYKERIVVGIDAQNGMVAVSGWVQKTQILAMELAEDMRRLGFQEIIYTDISKDGMLEGPNITELQAMAGVGLKIIASGGISSLDDVRQLTALEPMGVYGAIIGQALYCGNIDLQEAIAVAKGVVR